MDTYTIELDGELAQFLLAEMLKVQQEQKELGREHATAGLPLSELMANESERNARIIARKLTRLGVN